MLAPVTASRWRSHLLAQACKHAVPRAAPTKLIGWQYERVAEAASMRRLHRQARRATRRTNNADWMAVWVCGRGWHAEAAGRGGGGARRRCGARAAADAVYLSSYS
jgi:hypothetical protein